MRLLGVAPCPLAAARFADPDRRRPFTLAAGSTVGDLARTIHNDIAAKLRFARVWGHGAFAGQSVGEAHLLADRDVVEIHV